MKTVHTSITASLLQSNPALSLSYTFYTQEAVSGNDISEQSGKVQYVWKYE
ncbi:hypothetical protein ACFSTE_22395 [Aquimarina hainanensis]|uniref:Uncharacterized protein n=1 Tax=Aquimarina hainanensis TaxID=1578017 RepID=A0ABW5NDQ3_9FLAO